MLNGPARKLRDITLFNDCSDDELRGIDALVTELVVMPGRELARQGAHAREFLVIGSGEALVTRDGEEIGRLGAGSFVGEMALLDGGRRSATVTAATLMTIYVLHTTDFWALLQLAPRVAAKIQAAAAARRDAADHIVAA